MKASAKHFGLAVGP